MGAVVTGFPFTKMVAPDGLVPPDGGTFEDLRAFDITELSAKRGWLIFAFTEDKAKKSTVGKKPSSNK